MSVVFRAPQKPWQDSAKFPVCTREKSYHWNPQIPAHDWQLFVIKPHFFPSLNEHPSLSPHYSGFVSFLGSLWKGGGKTTPFTNNLCSKMWSQRKTLRTRIKSKTVVLAFPHTLEAWMLNWIWPSTLLFSSYWRLFLLDARTWTRARSHFRYVYLLNHNS